MKSLNNLIIKIGGAVIGLSSWIFIYINIKSWSDTLVYDILNLTHTNLASALAYFIYDTVKIFLLLILMVYLLAWIRAGLKVEVVRDTLQRLPKWLGYTFGSIFGAITPFCSCSSIPLFLGFTSAGIPLGITASFLITSPIINEVAVVVLFGLLGTELTLIYVAIGLLAGIVGGIFLDAVKADRWLEDFIKEALNRKISRQQQNHRETITFDQRHQFAKDETFTIVRRVGKWIVLGVGVGALIHGFVPETWISENLADGQWWSVPLAILLGTPLYTNVTGIVPVMESLLLKGLPLGTTFAFSLSSVAMSLPELLMLKQVMKPKLLILFFGYLMVMFTVVGFVMNAFQTYLY